MDKKELLKKIHAQLGEMELMCRDFTKATPIPVIDIDIFRAKIRDLYEVAKKLENLPTDSLLSKDRMESFNSMQTPAPPAPPVIPQPQKKEIIEPVQAQPRRDPLPVREPIPAPSPEVKPPPPPPPVKAPEPKVEIPQPSVPKPREPEFVPIKKATAPSPRMDDKKEETSKTASQDPSSTRLGEKMKSEKEAVNEIYSKAKKATSGTSMMQPISDIFAAIGLNDRFLFTRELFNNDSSLFKSTITSLNNLSDFDEARGELDHKFSWKEEDPTVDMFYNVIKRRYL